MVLFSWLLWGDFAWSVRDRAIPPLMQMLLQKFGASDLQVGLIFGSLPGLLGIFVGPVVSYKSDRHRGRRGRRIPFILFPTPFMAAAVMGLAFSPLLGTYLHKAMGSHSPGMNPSVLICFAIFWTLFELASMVSNAVYGALINDVVPHSLLGRFYSLFRATSLFAGIFFSYWFLGKAETLYVWIFLGIAAVYAIGVTSMCLNVKEGEYPDQLPMDHGRPARGIVATAKAYFQECFSHGYYRWYFAATIIAATSNIPFNLFAFFFAKSIGMSTDTYGKCLSLTWTISLFLSFPIGWLADRFHPLRVALAMLVLYTSAMLAGFLLTRNITTFGIFLVLHGVLAGAWGTSSASIGQRLLPQAEFAQFCSAGGVVGTLFGIAVAPSVGFLLDQAHHQYRYTFLIGFWVSVLGVVLLAILHSKFMALGGPKAYSAPE